MHWSILSKGADMWQSIRKLANLRIRIGFIARVRTKLQTQQSAHGLPLRDSFLHFRT